MDDDKIAVTAGTTPSSAPDSPTLSAELDDEYGLYKQHGDVEVEATEAKRVLRKIDKRVVPILFFIYLLQYLDKNGINYASVYGLEEGLDLHGQNYSWLGSIFYFGKLDKTYTT
jgi:hypothetical protein